MAQNHTTPLTRGVAHTVDSSIERAEDITSSPIETPVVHAISPTKVHRGLGIVHASTNTSETEASGEDGRTVELSSLHTRLWTEKSIEKEDPAC